MAEVHLRRSFPATVGELIVPTSPFDSPDAECLAYLAVHRTELLAWLEAVLALPPEEGDWPQNPLPLLRLAGRRWIQRQNQFLVLDVATDAKLDELLRRFAADFRAALHSAPETLPNALRRLRFSLAEAIRQPGQAASPPAVVCAEYSLSSQLRILGLSIAELAEPILDLGCGEHAELVRELQRQGKQAFGIDRVAGRIPGVMSADWFAKNFGNDTWGTIVSHLGFSLQFLHQHLQPGGDGARYAHKYMEILRSLKTGGIFVYAPGLPFVEDFLPAAQYRVIRRGVEGLPVNEDLSALYRRALGTDPFYTCRIERIG
ncbi:MAG: class I SAM-dependent methyltransferase [Myxococcales bacterium]|nr:class I SAM-dependent methyltransferase [Myxococcales bacterium]